MSPSKIITSSVKPLYAVAGATEVAYEFAREPRALRNQARSAVNARVAELQKEAIEAQNKFEARVAELQQEARALPKKVQNEIDDTVTELAKTYADLVDRGEKIVALIRKDGVKAVTAVRKVSTSSSLVRRERAKVAVDKPQNNTRPVKKPATKKPVAKKAPAKSTGKAAAATTSAAVDSAQSTGKKTRATANGATV